MIDKLEYLLALARERNFGVRDGDWVKLGSRAGGTALRARITDRMAPGVVYTTFHHPSTQANVVTTDYSDWATNCPTNTRSRPSRWHRPTAPATGSGTMPNRPSTAGGSPKVAAE